MYFLRNLWEALTYPFRRLLSLPAAVLTAPRRFWGMSLPMRMAILVACLLTVTWIAVESILAFYSHAPGWAVYLKRWPVIVLLILVISVIVYFTVRLWVEGRISRFPDIDLAFEAGLQSLRQAGLDLTNLPLYLVVGVASESDASPLIEEGIRQKVRGVPAGQAAVQWYATPNAAFLVCGDASCLSRVVSNMSLDGAEEPSSSVGVRRETMSGLGPEPFDQPRRPEASAAALRGTMVGNWLRNSFDAFKSSSVARAKTKAVLPAAEEQYVTARLEHVCRLIRRVRQPMCPVNGVLTVLPFALLQKSDEIAKAFSFACRRDLDAIRQVTQARCPAICFITGMDSESGFRELVRRVGPERARHLRFGKGFGVWNPPTAEQLESLSKHACGAFEDVVYELFREKDGFNKPGNTRLYELLCKVRSQCVDRLEKVLVGGFSMEPDNQAKVPEPMLLSGCYFAATGASEDRRAFVQGVFNKLLSEENDLEWTEEALQGERRYQNLAAATMLVNVLLLISLCVLGLRCFMAAS